MSMSPKDTLKFLAEFLALPKENEKIWLSFQNECIALEQTLLRSQAPCKAEVRLALSGILRRLRMLTIFPELAGKRVLCFIGFSTSQMGQYDRLSESIPEVSWKDASPKVFNTSGAGMEMQIPQIVKFLQTLSENNDSIDTLLSALLVPQENIPPDIAYIRLTDRCSPETTLFREILETADDFILEPDLSSELRTAALSYLNIHRPNVPLWLGNTGKAIKISENLHFRKGNPVIQKQCASFTPFSFLFQWALQPFANWMTQQENELTENKKQLSEDRFALMGNSKELDASIKNAQTEITNRLGTLQDLEKNYQSKRQKLIHLAGDLDSNFSVSSDKPSLSIDDWTRAEDHLLRLVDVGSKYLTELSQHIASMRRSAYPYPCILECVETLNGSNTPLPLEITEIDRPAAHRLCIRLRHDLNLTDAEAGRRHALSLHCENADEWYVRGIALMATNTVEAGNCLKKALELGNAKAGKLLYKICLSPWTLIPKTQSKTEEFLLNALVPEMCFEKAMRSGSKPFDKHDLFLLYISAAQDYIPALREVASLERKKSYEKNSPPNEQILHRKQAISLYEHLEKIMGSLSSEEYFLLGKLLYDDDHFQKSKSYLQKSEEAEAYTLIGNMYRDGKGVEIDSKKAKKFYLQAVAKGDLVALSHLRKLQKKNKESQKKEKISNDGDYRPKETSEDNGCFLTTATCSAMGYKDDCEVLQAYRRYRDDILAKEDDGSQIIKEYYELAPEILKRIDKLYDSASVYRAMWEEYLLPGYKLLLEKRYPEAKKLYIKLVTSLMERFEVKR